MPERTALLVHLTPGRARLRVPVIVDRPAEGRRLADQACAIPGVSKVEARTATGSIVIFHMGDWNSIAGALEEATGLDISEPPLLEPHATNALGAASALVNALDDRARRAFGGRTDLSEITFLMLLLAGVAQIARGQLVGPAATLFAQALSLMAARRHHVA